MNRRNPLAALDGDEPVAALAHRPTKAKRNRQWEKENADVVTYRAPGLKAINARLKRYAHRHSIATIGEAALLVLETGLTVLENKPQAAEYHA